MPSSPFISRIMFLFVSYSSLYYEVFDLESKKAINPVNKLICWYVSLRKGKVKNWLAILSCILTKWKSDSCYVQANASVLRKMET